MTRLTVREIEICELMANGKRATYIADRLQISKRTVDYHLSHIYEKLGVRDRLGAVLAWQRISEGSDRGADAATQAERNP